MQWLLEKINWLRHLAEPEQLRELVNLGGPPWVSYLILFAIIFSETGLLIGFFLPGDSLLFAAGVLAAGDASGKGVFRIDLLILVLSAAAVLGDAVNYFLGLQMEEHVFEKGRMRFVKHEHLMAAKAFYERHGGKAIVLARFVPLVRTFTPFVAGVARMGYRRFAIYNIAGGIGWVTLMSLAGFWLGNIPFVKNHFEQVVIAIVAISLLPVAIAAFRAWRGRA
ncbi:MAG TPA: VTT domain-containing protein [Pirellulales bacterium]|jgi:membrane-associated protein|nr:VTT domain-containing protein [Pirellulales bacterium]